MVVIFLNVVLFFQAFEHHLYVSVDSQHVWECLCCCLIPFDFPIILVSLCVGFWVIAMTVFTVLASIARVSTEEDAWYTAPRRMC